MNTKKVPALPVVFGTRLWMGKVKLLEKPDRYSQHNTAEFTKMDSN